MSSRRDFIKKTALAGTGIAMLPNLSFGIGTGLPKDKLRIGMIGVGLRSANHLNNLLHRDDVLITAICDIDPNRIAIAKKKINKAGQKAPDAYDKTSIRTAIY